MVQSGKLTRRLAVGHVDAITLSQPVPRLDSVSAETEQETNLGTTHPAQELALRLVSCYPARRHNGGTPRGDGLLLACATLINRPV